MTAYLLRRLAVAVLLVFATTSASLLLMRAAPGDAASVDLRLDAAQRARIRAEAGLDEPPLRQYTRWLGNALRLDFGTSLVYSRPVGDMVTERLVNTSLLAAAALLLATIIGLPLGVVSGSTTGLAARLIRTGSLFALSIPPLLGSLALVALAAATGWLPPGGMTSAASAGAAWPTRALDIAWHMPVPALALALPLAAMLERVQAQAIAETLTPAFVGGGLARGITRTRVVLAHAWRNSLGPVLGLYGLFIGTLFSGSFVVEVVTAWPGLGRLLFDALRARDIYLVAGTVAASAAVLAAGILVTDLLHGLVDPRIRTESER